MLSFQKKKILVACPKYSKKASIILLSLLRKIPPHSARSGLPCEALSMLSFKLSLWGGDQLPKLIFLTMAVVFFSVRESRTLFSKKLETD